MSVRHAMLALLSEGLRYGLRLREEFEDRTGEVWPLNVDAELFRLDSVVRWLDVADARLKRAEADTAAPEPGQVRAPLPRRRRELRIPR